MERGYTLNDVQHERFYKLPKALFANPRYQGLSLAAKAAYALLRDRHEVSIQNGWKDAQGVLYFLYSSDNLAEILEVTEKTARKYKKELQDYGLITEKRQGRGMANRIYILKPELPVEVADEQKNSVQNGKNDRSRTVKNTAVERSFLPGNETERSETKKILNELNEGAVAPDHESIFKVFEEHETVGAKPYLEDYYNVLLTHFPRQIDADVLRVALDRMETSIEKIGILNIENLPGLFYRCYSEAIKLYKATRFKNRGEGDGRAGAAV